MKKNDPPVVVEQIYNNSVSEVWEAITRVDQMRHWFFNNIPEFKPQVGFKTEFNVQSAGRDFMHQWQVTEVIPWEMITYSWKYDGYAGDSFVSFELFEKDNAVLLKLSHHVIEDFAEGIPEFKRENCVAGWDYFIKESLTKFLQKDGNSKG